MAGLLKIDVADVAKALPFDVGLNGLLLAVEAALSFCGIWLAKMADADCSVDEGFLAGDWVLSKIFAKAEVAADGVDRCSSSSTTRRLLLGSSSALSEVRLRRLFAPADCALLLLVRSSSALRLLPEAPALFGLEVLATLSDASTGSSGRPFAARHLRMVSGFGLTFLNS